jgi:UPF0755 protein
MTKSQYRLRIAVAIAGFIFISFSFYVYQIFLTPNVLIDEGDKEVELFIPTGATIETVKDSLTKKRIVHDQKSFFFLTRLLNYNEAIKPGRYIITPKMANLQLIKKLKRGLQDPVKLTFNNIRLKQDLIQRLDVKIEASEHEIDSMMKDVNLTKQYGFDTTTILSMFIPNTYEFYWNTSAKKLFDRMHDEYQKFWNEERIQKAKSLGLTPVQVSIMASIVEAETQQRTEKSRIAGVYLNRLKQGMPLQADPTVKFAIGDFSIKRILSGHTQIESPYNTYKYAGLPPGPINLPSVVSLDAVLNAENHKYLYFCASPKNPGFHDFAEDYNDHVNNANRYHKHLNKIKIQ